MKEIHVLVDFENVQPTMEELAKLAPALTDVWLFHGPNEAKKARLIAAAHSHVTLIPHSGKGKNALDFHLSFYLGYVAARHPDAQLVVVANDKGYDAMIAHAKQLGFTARRMGHKAKRVPVEQAEPANKVAPAKTPVPAKKAASATPPAKLAAKKKLAEKVIAQPLAVSVTLSKVPAKKTVTKKVVPQKAAAKKASTKQSATAVPVAMPSLDAKTITRIQKGLVKMGDKAPHKLHAFLRHVGAQLGKGSTAAQINAVVAKLAKAGSVQVAGDLVLYSGK